MLLIARTRLGTPKVVCSQQLIVEKGWGRESEKDECEQEVNCWMSVCYIAYGCRGTD